ncbi:hypothetical protein MKP08_06035 [Erythrobacter sp. LQ02-29]|uniref:hypothetical protein n=1 Tax=unclassified Erythrobacter TaxID=2633097 RepID=UPI001BFBF84E|nr:MULTISPECIES: hypothetical protein [unclassified Erythrobacter]MCP9222305.1 hypothetical protein [Erythrobacter sp. LQ02-29]QWC56394.1 hypothetical protein F7D01_04175 [Erythrobacter sp. 3-20A1M]
MGLFDQVMGAARNHPTVKNMADKLGIEPETAEKAIAALAEAHHQDGDTIRTAADKTGIDADILSQIRDQIGGEGSLAKFASMLDQDNDGNPFDDVANFASGLFGKK